MDDKGEVSLGKSFIRAVAIQHIEQQDAQGPAVRQQGVVSHLGDYFWSHVGGSAAIGVDEGVLLGAFV